MVYGTNTVAPCSSVMLAGFFVTKHASVVVCVAMPWSSSPNTSSPTFTFVTFAPTRSTTPDASSPMVMPDRPPAKASSFSRFTAIITSL